jgi:hypothetical protein
MVLVLFYVESLRKFIVDSISLRDKLSGCDRLGSPKAKKGKMMEIVRAILVSEEVLSQAESEELFELLNYRNLIGHQVHGLTADVGAYSYLSPLDPKTHAPKAAYDYTAAKRAKALKKKVEKGMMGTSIMSIGFDVLQFEVAEKTYLIEINRLKARVNKGIGKANREIAKTNEVIRSIPKETIDRAQPGHPRNQKESGALTEAGRSCAFALFDANATPLAVSHLMRISLRSANFWFSRWDNGVRFT